MKLKKLMILFCGLLLSSALWAQQKAITGTVVDSTGDALPGVNVVVEGTTTGTVTTIDGTFSLNVPSDTKFLTVSFIGFASQKIDVANKSNVTITLKPDVIA